MNMKEDSWSEGDRLPGEAIKMEIEEEGTRRDTRAGI